MVCDGGVFRPPFGETGADCYTEDAFGRRLAAGQFLRYGQVSGAGEFSTTLHIL